MAEYIEREALMEQVKAIHRAVDTSSINLAYNTGFHSATSQIQGLIASLPAADVVEVPCRCKACKHWKYFDHLGCTDFVKVCGISNYMIGANGYCLYGERTGDHADHHD